MLKSGMKWIGVIGICLIILAQPLNMIEQTKAQGTPINQLVDGAITFILGILPASLSEGASHILYFFFADFPLLVWDVLRMILVMFRSIFADNPEKDEEAANTEKEKTEPVDTSEQFSKAAFRLAIFLAVILFVLYVVIKSSRSKSSQF